MAYRVQRSQKVIEDLELVDESGAIAERIHVQLDADDMVRKVSRKYLDLMRIQKEVTSIQDDHKEAALEQLGDAIIDLFEAIFGEADTEKILNFYEGNYIEMIQSVMPFISEVILPRMRQISQQKRQAYNRKALKHGIFN